LRDQFAERKLAQACSFHSLGDRLPIVVTSTLDAQAG
jgi:hypothetical protein